MASIATIVSNPVDIPSVNKNIKDSNKDFLFSTDEAYMVTSHIFDPYRSSPPSSWNIRLQERLKQFENKNVIKLMI